MISSTVFFLTGSFKPFVYYLAAMNRLAEIILNKSLDECTAEELQRIADKYPYFNAAHLLAATKIQSAGTAEAKATIQKAGLHFHPLQLSALINTAGNAVVVPKEIIETRIAHPQADQILEKAEELAVSEPEIVSPAEAEIFTVAEEKIVVQEIQPEPLPEPQQKINEQPETNNQQPVFGETSEEDPITSNQQPVLTETLEDKPANSNPQPATSDPPLAFEPFYTVDYFASQGIKVKLEDIPQDKFTRQLRSFTEWLKTMKKLPVTEVAAPVTNETSEKKVEQLAEVSLTDSNVVTEAMAEVWAKQGNIQKAIEIYHKLSLLEPVKSPYFASRISDLKNN
jgi:hypothetical protein